MRNKKVNNLEFGTFIKNTRLGLKIGVREFASQIGISSTYISKMEIGDYGPPKEENVKKMAVILKVNPDKLLAIGNKLSSDIKNIINSNPNLYTSFIRKASTKDIKQFMKLLINNQSQS